MALNGDIYIYMMIFIVPRIYAYVFFCGGLLSFYGGIWPYSFRGELFVSGRDKLNFNAQDPCHFHNLFFQVFLPRFSAYIFFWVSPPIALI